MKNQHIIESEYRPYPEGESTELEQFPQADTIFDSKRPDYLPPKPNALPDHLKLYLLRQEIKKYMRRGK